MASAVHREVAPGSNQWFGRAAAFTKVGAPSDRTFQFLASDSSVDRMGDTIDPKGWDLTNYLKNPVVLYAHDNQSIPIGRTVKAWIDEAGLHVQIQIDDHTDLDKAVAAKLESGTLRAVSVGFRPIEMEWVDRTADDLPSGIDFKRQELLEMTICPVPANANALAEARTKSMATIKADDEMGGHVKALGEHVKTLGEHMKAFAKGLDDMKKFVQGDDATTENDKAFRAAIERLDLTAEQKAAVLKAAEAGHAMHPDVAKCVKGAHSNLCKALDLHNRAAGADANPPAQKPGGDGKPGDDEDEDDEKAMTAFLTNQKRIDDLTTRLTGRIS